MENTTDPNVWIIERSNDFIYYKNSSGKTWRVSGTCIACGLCENIKDIGTYQEENILPDGSSYLRTLIWNNVPGTAGACIEIDYDKRPDIPVTPDLMNNIHECTLVGEWINGN